MKNNSDPAGQARHKILCIIGARPNFMKIAPIMHALNKNEFGIDAKLVHTGQHYDVAMNHQFFTDLGIPAPEINLEVGSGSHAVQTAEIMRRFEPVLDQEQPAAVLVVGDVNSTIACALVAAKKEIPVIHVEAGLRSYDRAMPEEINRVLTDQISDLLFTTERTARDNLLREGIAGERIHFVGNVMIDSLHHNLAQAIPAAETFRLAQAAPQFTGLKGSYAVLTLHRPSNVDDAATLGALLETVIEVSRQIPVAFPLHPRTRSKITQFQLDPLLEQGNILVLPPMGYLQILGLMQSARFFLTDSGGIQEETTALGVPCFTLRHNTERQITIDEGTNILVGQDQNKILAAVQDVFDSGGKSGNVPEYWDGNAARRILTHIQDWLTGKVSRED
ncbi:MAG TPA: UDP-N-acetylglucosamine 2-epimerase (non-hydrolyzing) [Burkholderiales bacterium]|nr:UDP-N-acetylglucosamine 2-epimerase (non-hydrolyzing) [Burkholderiales bacterium]